MGRDVIHIDIVVPIENLKPGLVGYEVTVSSPGDAEILDKVADVTIDPAAGGAAPQNVTLACATAGASIILMKAACR